MDIDLPTAIPAFSISTCALPGLSISSFTGGSSRIIRTSSQALAANNDLVICIAKNSHVKVQRSGRPARIFAPGEAHVWQGDKATHFEVEKPYQATMMTIPAVGLVKESVDLDRTLDEGIATHAVEFKMLAGYVNNLLSCSQYLSTQAASVTARHIREMVVLALRSFSYEKYKEPTSNSQRALRLERIKADIRTHLSNPGLSPSWLASREGISDRYLRYLLAEEQTHFSKLVLEMRLTQSYEQLTNPRYYDQTISAIAFNCGFSDLSYFCRVFKRRYSCTPTEVRQQSLHS